VATWIPSATAIAAGNNGFTTTNVPGYSTGYNGLEVGITKRLSNKWMSRVGFSWNDATEHFDEAAGMYDTNGNPTPTVTEPLKNGGQFAPQSGGSGSGTIYINAKWQFNANAMYQAPYGIELSANVFGRQGYPRPFTRTGGTAAQLGADSSITVLVSPEIDSYRYPNLWNTDIRVAKQFQADKVRIRAIFDVFNIMNANTALVRVSDVTATGGTNPINTLAQNLSPRIARVGIVLGF
jgi:hypothetical protein